MLHFQAQANRLADGVVVVAGHQGQHLQSSLELQGIEEVRPPESLAHHPGTDR